MKFDRKLLLIAPTIILVLIVAAIASTGMQLRVLTEAEKTWKDRSEFVSSVESRKRTLSQTQAVELLRISLDVENRRTMAIRSAVDLLYALAAMTLLCVVMLAFGIRRVPREHWPRFKRAGPPADAAAESSSAAP
jgi:hypothetical protein